MLVVVVLCVCLVLCLLGVCFCFCGVFLKSFGHVYSFSSVCQMMVIVSYYLSLGGGCFEWSYNCCEFVHIGLV